MIVGIFIILWLTAHAQQISPLTGWVINITYSSPSFNPPGVTNNQTCIPTEYQYPYMQTNYTFPFAGVQEIIIVTDADLEYYIAIYYGSFNPSYPCSNFVRYVRNLKALGPQIDDFYFEMNVPYFFVVTVAPDPQIQLLQGFALNIFESTKSGNSSTNTLWRVVEYANSTKCEITNIVLPFDTYIWTPNTTGLYDILGALEYTRGQLLEFSLGLYKGEVPDSILQADPCPYLVAGNQSFTAANILAIPLIAELTYTLVISGGTPESFGHYGIQIVPTRTYTLQPGWISPNLSYPCTPALPLNDSSWVALSFTAQYSYVFVSAVPNLETFVYAGENTGNETNPPETCPEGIELILYSTDTHFSFPTIPFENYTIILSNSGYSPVDSIQLYVLSGASVSMPSSTTGTGVSTLFPSSLTSSTTRIITTSIANLTSTSTSTATTTSPSTTHTSTTSSGAFLTTSACYLIMLWLNFIINTKILF